MAASLGENANTTALGNAVEDSIVDGVLVDMGRNTELGTLLRLLCSVSVREVCFRCLRVYTCQLLFRNFSLERLLQPDLVRSEDLLDF